MPTPLRVLILEDSEADALLMVEQLRDVGFDPTWHRVETEAEFAAQANPEWDIILADYHQPQFDALRALEVLKKKKNKPRSLILLPKKWIQLIITSGQK